MFYSNDPLFWLLAVIGVVMTGISKSGFAGGAGVLAVPLLALVIPVPVAAAMTLPLLIVMDIRTVMIYRHALTDLSHLKRIVPAALLGVAIAGVAMAEMPLDGLTIALAVISLLFAAWEPLLSVLGRLPGAAWLWGMVSGITSTLLHAGGPPITIYFLARDVQKQSWLAQVAVLFAIMNVVKVIPYSINNLWTLPLLMTCLVLTPCALLGVSLGRALQVRMSQQVFIRLCRILLAGTGVLLLLRIVLA